MKYMIFTDLVTGGDYSEGSSLVCCKEDRDKCMSCNASKKDECFELLSKKYSYCEGK